MTVLQQSELEKSPLADLHAIASELGVEGFRGLRRDDLVAGIVRAQGGEPSEPSGGGDDEGGAEEADGDAEEPKRPARRRNRRGGGGRSRGGGPKEAKDTKDSRDSDDDRDDASDDDDDRDDSDREVVSGILDVLPNGSGFLRSGADQDSDVYVSAAQIRRCELRGGDDVSGRMRPARRNEKHPSLVRVEQVNGRDAEPPEERPLFSDLTAVHPTEKLPVPDAIGLVPIAKGSRVAVAGGPGAGATRLLRELAGTLGATDGLTVSVALVGVRPEEVTDWKRADGDVPVVGGSFDESVEAQTQAAELAVEQAKRVAERGGDAVVVIDSLEALPAGAARRLFGAARKLEEGGSLTVIAASGMAWEPQRQASTRIALDGPAEDGAIQVAAGALGRTARGSHRLGAERMPDPAREPETPDEELLEAETAAIARLYTDEDRVERMAGELRVGVRHAVRHAARRVGVRLRPHAARRPAVRGRAPGRAAAGGGGLHRDHRRRAGDHGGGQPRRRRRGRAVGRPGHRPARRSRG